MAALLSRGVKIARQFFRIWVGRPIFDLVPVSASCVVANFAYNHPPGNTTTRQLCMQALATVFAGVLAFAITGTTVILAVTPGARLQSMLVTLSAGIIRVVMLSATILSITAVASAILIVFDRTEHSRLVATCELASAAFGVIATLRLIWIFYQIFIVLAADRRGVI